MDLHKKKYTIVDGFRCNRKGKVMKPTINSKIGYYIKRHQSILDILMYERNHFDFGGLVLLPDKYINEFSEDAYNYVSTYRKQSSPKFRMLFLQKQLSFQELIQKYVTPQNILHVVHSDLQLLVKAQYSVNHYIIIADYKPVESLKNKDIDDQFMTRVNLTLLSKNKKDRGYCDLNKLGIKDLTTVQKRNMLAFNVPQENIFGNHKFGFTLNEINTWWNTYEQVSHPKPTKHQSFFIKMSLVNYLNSRFLRDCTILADTYNDMDNYAQETTVSNFDMSKLIEERLDEADD